MTTPPRAYTASDGPQSTAANAYTEAARVLLDLAEKARKRWAGRDLIYVDVREVEHLAAGLQARAEEAERPDRATQHLPDHNYTMPHDQRFRPYDIRHCPPNCPYRLAVQARKSQS